MKTNQLMTVAFEEGSIEFEHLTGMGNLTQLFTLGNKYRALNNNKAVNFTLFMNSKATKEFIKIIADRQYKKESDVVKHNGRKGKNSKTFADLHFLIYVASELDMNFKYEIIDTFIKNRVLEVRDDGGNDFKELNYHINNLPDRMGRNNTGVFVTVAKSLRSKIFRQSELECLENEFPKKTNIWNTSLATSYHQDKRVEYEKELSILIKRGYVTTYEQLKEAIEKL